MNAQHRPRGKQDRFDKRIAFVAQCLNQKITDNANLANEWFINHGGASLHISDAIDRFKKWLNGGQP